jgi:hypothetical protein
MYIQSSKMESRNTKLRCKRASRGAKSSPSHGEERKSLNYVVCFICYGLHTELCSKSLKHYLKFVLHTFLLVNCSDRFYGGLCVEQNGCPWFKLVNGNGIRSQRSQSKLPSAKVILYYIAFIM